MSHGLAKCFGRLSWELFYWTQIRKGVLWLSSLPGDWEISVSLPLPPAPIPQGVSSLSVHLHSLCDGVPDSCFFFWVTKFICLCFSPSLLLWNQGAWTCLQHRLCVESSPSVCPGSGLSDGLPVNVWIRKKPESSVVSFSSALQWDSSLVPDCVEPAKLELLLVTRAWFAGGQDLSVTLLKNDCHSWYIQSSTFS